VVLITGRNELDDQVYDTFAASNQLLRQEPVQAKDRTQYGFKAKTIDVKDADGNKIGKEAGSAISITGLVDGLLYLMGIHEREIRESNAGAVV
jgi:hypothetical protein